MVRCGMIDCRLVLCDVDGTLAYEKSLVSEQNRIWVSRLVLEKHVPFVIVSGRMRSGVSLIARQIPAPVGICAFNGGYIEIEGKPIYEKLMDYDLAKEVVHIAHEFGVECILFDLDQWYAEKGGKLYDEQSSLYGFCGHAVEIEQTLKEWKNNRHPLYKCIPKSLDVTLAVKVRDALEKRMGEKLAVFGSSPFVVEAVPKGVDKARALDMLCNYYHISPSRVMAFGDYDNDAGMIEACGYGVAMANGVDVVKRKARYVTDTNKNDGVAKGIRKFFFEE